MINGSDYFAVLRHGYAENNEAEAKMRAGDRRSYDLVIRRPSSLHDLTAMGCDQALRTGEWLKRHGLMFTRHVVSGYVRALRTARLLDISSATWEIEERLCERDSGILNSLTPSGVRDYFKSRGNERHTLDTYRFRPEDGESFLDLDVRIRSIFESQVGNSLFVCHGH